MFSNMMYNDPFICRWCGPCKALEPRLENVIAQRKGNVSLAKVDIDDFGELATKYEVSFDL